MGGDKAKANDLADRIAAVNATRGWMARASLAHEAKDAAAELDCWLKAIASDDSSFEAWAGLTQYHLDRPKPDWAEVEETGCRLVQLDAGRPDGWRALIEAHVASHCWTEVDSLLAAAEPFNAEDLTPYYAAAAAMIRSEERLDAAKVYLDRYLRQPAEGSEPTHAMARWQLATLLEKQQLPDEAVAELTRALESDPTLEPAKKDLKRLRGK
jgi:tetratricopeptide (TPR) repeat protein